MIYVYLHDLHFVEFPCITNKHDCLKEQDSRPMTPEVIDQDYTVLPSNRPPPSAMSDKEKKAFAKQEKERMKVWCYGNQSQNSTV